MRVLWFTDIPMPAMYRHRRLPPYRDGLWMQALLEKLSAKNNIQLGVATAFHGLHNDHFKEGKVEYFVIGQSRMFSDMFVQRSLERCAKIVKGWKPDLVHIHGSERFYGLLSALGLIDTPTVVSLQGLMTVCSEWTKYFGTLSFWEILKSHRLIHTLAGVGLVWGYWDYKRRARRELEIFRGNNTFLGRTDWDRAHVWSVKPQAHYYYVGRILRQPFYATMWNIQSCRRHSIIFTNAGKPRHGTETLLEAVRLLRNEFPDVKLRMAGRISRSSGYGRFLHRRIDRMGLSDSVDLLGYLNAEEVAKELQHSYVFALASHIENSPNSLSEAQLVGMPCVASYCGGVPSLIDEGRTGLLFPPGDASMLAHAIRQIFQNDALAIQLGKLAREVARERHCPQVVTSQLLEAYHSVITNDREDRHQQPCLH